MERTIVSIEVGLSVDEGSRASDARLGVFDRLVSGDQTEEDQYDFDGLSALPAPTGQLEPIDEAVEKLKKAFGTTSGDLLWWESLKGAKEKFKKAFSKAAP